MRSESGGSNHRVAAPGRLVGVMWMMAMAMAGTLSDLDWVVVNDTVMGGVSRGRTEALDGGQVRFTGELSLERNGGFVSVRTRPAALGLEDARALTVRVRGDGRAWKLLAYRADVPLRAGSYRTEILTRDGEVVEVSVPLADFEASSFGRPVPDAPALDVHPERIVSLGFLLADKRPGPFVLEVLSIRVEHGRRVPTPDPDLLGALERAVAQGVPAFNRGGAAGFTRCRDLYRAALAGVATSPALSDGEQRIVSTALADAASQDPRSAAWTLRYAIDALTRSRSGAPDATHDR